MPPGTSVETVYQALRKKGYDKGKAARIAQSQTGEALATGRPPKHHAVATANEPPERDLGAVPSSQRTTQALSPGQQILQDARQATADAEATAGLMQAGPDGIYQCSTCGYRADSPRPHNCEGILNRQRRITGWSGFRMPH